MFLYGGKIRTAATSTAAQIGFRQRQIVDLLLSRVLGDPLIDEVCRPHPRWG
jgi:hypothetical protein